MRLDNYKQFEGNELTIQTNRGGKEIGILLNVDEKYAELTILTTDNRLVTVSKSAIGSISIKLTKPVTELVGFGHNNGSSVKALTETIERDVEEIPKENPNISFDNTGGIHGIQYKIPTIPLNGSKDSIQ